ncbi:MAG: hypothetical protein JWN59_1398 [Sphingomonas bacterium]|nr:hypothetical protein [Sphingomonas bacterium]
MRTHALAFALAVAAAAPTAAATRSYSVTGFERIRVEGPYSVTLKVGPSNSAVATGDQRAIDRLRVEVQSRTLVIRADRSASGGWQAESPGRLTIAVATPALTAAILAGSGSLAIDRAKAMRFDLAVSGSGSATIGALASDRLSLALVGSGEIVIGGSAAQTRASLQGSGTIDATRLAADDLDLSVTGSGDAHFTARRTAKVTTTGSGGVTVDGKPACTVTSSGSGEVRCGGAQRVGTGSAPE